MYLIFGQQQHGFICTTYYMHVLLYVQVIEEVFVLPGYKHALIGLSQKIIICTFFSDDHLL